VQLGPERDPVRAKARAQMLLRLGPSGASSRALTEQRRGSPANQPPAKRRGYGSLQLTVHLHDARTPWFHGSDVCISILRRQRIGLFLFAVAEQ
jgi:hypothetical protein